MTHKAKQKKYLNKELALLSFQFAIDCYLPAVPEAGGIAYLALSGGELKYLIPLALMNRGLKSLLI